MKRYLALLFAAALVVPEVGEAAPAYACGGEVVGGGAQILCSHVNSQAPPQSCIYFWSLKATDATTTVVQGSFLLSPGSSNSAVYQGVGFDSELAGPIIICQGTEQGRTPP
jgi:hypothetical protein